jgi:hypothetical protein
MEFGGLIYCQNTPNDRKSIRVLAARMYANKNGEELRISFFKKKASLSVIQKSQTGG